MVLIDGDRCALVQCMKSALFDDVNGSESTMQCKHLVDLNLFYFIFLFCITLVLLACLRIYRVFVSLRQAVLP